MSNMSETDHQRVQKLKFDTLGKIFVMIVVCVLTPAYGLSISLLFLMSSIFASILLYNLIHVWFNMRGIRMTLENIPDLYAGTATRLPITLTNRKRFFSSNYLELSMVAGEQECTGRLMKLKPGATETLHLELKPEKRGWLEISRFRCGSGYPFGMFHHYLEIRVNERVLVYPKLLDRLPEILAVNEKEKGKIPISSGDYQYLSAYQPGDDVRLIHWKRSTLLEDPVVRKDLMSTHRSEPKLFVPDPCQDFEFAVSAIASRLFTSGVSGWSIYTEDGPEPVETLDEALRHLALTIPLSHVPDAENLLEQGFRAVYASQITADQ